MYTKKHRNKLTQKQISRKFEKDTVQESYDKRLEEIQNNIKEVQKISGKIHERVYYAIKKK